MLLTVTCAELFQRAQLARPDTHLTITFVKVSSIMLCVVMVVVEFEDMLPEVGIVSSDPCSRSNSSSSSSSNSSSTSGNSST